MRILGHPGRREYDACRNRKDAQPHVQRIREWADTGKLGLYGDRLEHKSYQHPSIQVGSSRVLYSACKQLLETQMEMVGHRHFERPAYVYRGWWLPIRCGHDKRLNKHPPPIMNKTNGISLGCFSCMVSFAILPEMSNNVAALLRSCQWLVRIIRIFPRSNQFHYSTDHVRTLGVK